MMTTEPQPIKSTDFLILAVKDELTGLFFQPIFCKSEAEGKRWFEFVLNDNKIWKSNAAMYSLYKLGTFNDKEGIKDYPTVELIVGGLSVKKEE